ncbi:MAG: polyprenyl synthetase family protein [Bacteroidales bacterium]|jgi:octaprenyl-diphosphate synthase|nr:polyprenyl synthetase family protein [Bacteroidales bacterium]NMD03390.1 polyprenyl synthetase family protein [Bacteroidales bacterium]OQB64606.1 MAG: Octaprenyl-diphosphate synthase [Bacteroidetes bacterium ADurb.Bin145]HOU00939.1 polyprenyl synthetase family protein [Bacteroidales bacterium]HQK66670.1 polyprenyl synthetase family protein [Bacteroidales bacterium]
MPVLNEIRKPVEKEMDEFESFFNRTMQSNIPLLKIILNYILRRKGKQMRPLLVFLTAGLNGTIAESTYVAATLIELLHTASLVHDDVVDDAKERRGALSINALWNSKIAVLVGDYMLSQGLLISLEKSRYEMLEIVSEAVKSMAEGELLQLQKARKLNIKEPDYYKIIISKTAALIAACTASGARSVTEDQDVIQQMKEFGENIGIAFQIRDDLLDYETNGLTGKIVGNDIKERKLTLPLIHSLEIASTVQRNRIMSIVKRKKKTRDEIKEVIEFVSTSGGLEYAELKMNQFRDKALAILDSYPDSSYKNSLKKFVYFTTSRNK